MHPLANVYSVYIIIFFFCYFLGNKYVPVFNSFNKVVSSCFSNDLDANYGIYIAEFNLQCQKANIKFTPKIHAVVHHIEDFIKMTNKPLGFYSEQASEQVHHSFKLFSRNYNLSPKSENFLRNLKRCVSSYNSLHI